MSSKFWIVALNNDIYQSGGGQAEQTKVVFWHTPSPLVMRNSGQSRLDSKHLTEQINPNWIKTTGRSGSRCSSCNSQARCSSSERRPPHEHHCSSCRRGGRSLLRLLSFPLSIFKLAIIIIKLMAKTYKNLFGKIIEIKNLMNAYRNAAKQKRFEKAILRFDEHLAQNLLCLQKELSNKTYKHGNYKFFTLYDPKEREISAAPFRDRIVHHAVCQILEPIFDRKFIYDSYACRQTKGSHRAVKRLQKFLIKIGYREKKKIYALKCDISKCFPSINHEILIKILKKKIKDKDTIWLLKEIISSYESGDKYNELFPVNSHFRTKRPRGIPIGNLTSQLFVNIYLNELDQYLKHQLKVKYYVRYVDDFVVLSRDKRYLHQLAEKIRTFLYDKLYLTLHPKKIRVFPVHLGIDFLGYVVFKDHILLRSKNVKAFRKRLRKFRKLYLTGKLDKQKIKESITSWLAHAEHADTYYLRKAIFGKPLTPKDQKEIEEFISSWKKREHKPFGQLRLF